MDLNEPNSLSQIIKEEAEERAIFKHQETEQEENKYSYLIKWNKVKKDPA